MANERLQALRALMKQKNIDMYYIPSTDFHDSEEVEAYFKCREFISGFSGSAGTMVITQDFSGMWTDGRYFVQAKKQLAGQDTDLMEMGNEEVPTVLEYIERNLPEGGVLGMDGRVVNTKVGQEFERVLEKKHGSCVVENDLVGEVWKSRPALQSPALWVLGVEYAGESVSDKISRVRKRMEEVHASSHIIASLDDIAWLLNIRKEAEDGNPLPAAFLLLKMDAVQLFIDSSRMDDKVRTYLQENNISVHAYGDIYDAARALCGETVLLETEKVNFALFKSIDSSNRIVEEMNPTSLMKAVKNPIEMENLRRAHLKDGVALTKFLYWLKTEGLKQNLTETEAAERVEAFRKEQEGYICPSFVTISAYGSNAAMCHYHPTKEDETVIGDRGFYLLDSGGHYYEGTTDVTRTVCTGPITDEMRLHYSLVLMGMLRLAGARFLYGCQGINLDYLARGPLWERGLNFNHGTGHGVGFLSNVHERPNGIRWKHVPERRDCCVMEEGMVTSDEPGLYIEGGYGIRDENLLLCRKGEKNMYGQFMYFETLTLAPFDTSALDLSVMERSDIRMLNEYQAMVYEKLAPHLNDAEREWLRNETKPVGVEE